MEFSRRRFVASAIAMGATFSIAGPLAAQTAGRDFVVLNPPVSTDHAAKIEVVEFFSYGCPHCGDFNPLLNLWAAKLPADVVLKKIPVSFGRAAWGNAAKLFYALEITGDLKRLESDVFKAIHQERTNLFDEKTIVSWVSARGVDRKKFTEAFGSFGVQSKLRRGDQMAAAYKIEGVPALAVDGKFLVGSLPFEQQLAVADKLIARARSEKAGKK
jgi:protein dithiol oxidoreductase (disulfide-forming)